MVCTAQIRRSRTSRRSVTTEGGKNENSSPQIRLLFVLLEVEIKARVVNSRKTRMMMFFFWLWMVITRF